MRTWKFQLAVVVLVGLFASQAVQAIQFYSLRTVEVDNGGETAFRQNVVVIDTEAGTVTDASESFFRSLGEEVIAIDTFPGNGNHFGDGDLAGLTRDGQILLLSTVLHPGVEFPVTASMVTQLTDIGGTDLSFPDGGGLAINTDVNDVEGAGLFQNFNVLRTDRDPFNPETGEEARGRRWSALVR